MDTLVPLFIFGTLLSGASLYFYVKQMLNKYSHWSALSVKRTSLTMGTLYVTAVYGYSLWYLAYTQSHLSERNSQVILAVASIVLIIPRVVYFVYAFIKYRYNSLLSARLARLARKKPYWDEIALNKRTQELFLRLKQDWSNNDADALRAYVTEPFATHLRLLVTALDQMKRHNEITVTKMLPAVAWAIAPSFEIPKALMQVNAVVTDRLVSDDGVEHYKMRITVCEYWTLVYVSGEWLLEHIDDYDVELRHPPEGNPPLFQRNNMFKLRTINNLYLPTKSFLFDSDVFGGSRITGHNIGEFDGVLTQFYTYETDSLNSKGALLFQVAQIVLPKHYGNIVLLPKVPLSGLLRPTKLQKMSLESSDFNDAYDVYASEKDWLAAFELFNPAFMSSLIDIPFECGLEVIDDNFYIFTTSASTRVKKILLACVAVAARELKM